MYIDLTIISMIDALFHTVGCQPLPEFPSESNFPTLPLLTTLEPLLIALKQPLKNP
jgi:hypothetical protein